MRNLTTRKHREIKARGLNSNIAKLDQEFAKLKMVNDDNDKDPYKNFSVNTDDVRREIHKKFTI